MSNDNNRSDQKDRSRRELLKLTGGIGASTLTFTGAASAGRGRGRGKRKGKKPEKGDNSTGLTRTQKAKRAGKEWDEEWIVEDRIGETWVGKIEESNRVTAQGVQRRELDIEIGFKGISIGISGYLGECEAELQVELLGQTRRNSLSCPNVCNFRHYDAGAAYLDVELCVNWNTKELEVNVDGCLWKVTGWDCGSLSRTV